MAQDEDYQDYEYIDESLDLDTENINPDEDLPIFEEILILEVQERPCLWDQRLDIKMRGMNIIRKAWEEVGRTLNTDPKMCQKKWKNLRDTFLRKCKEEKSYVASGSAATSKINNWKYYKQMEFLKPTTEHRRTFSNVEMIKDNKELPGFCARKNTNMKKEETWIQDRSSPSLLTMTTKSESKYVNRQLLSPSMNESTESDIFFVPSTSQASRSPTSSSSISCSSQKRKKSEETITRKSKKSSTEYPDRLESFLMEQVTQPLSEAATFCSFLKTRLQKLDQQDYLEATHNIMNELIRLETQISTRK